jgi:hypothetical protein
VSARSATGGAGDERQIDVQTRDEKGAAVRHAADGAIPGRAEPSAVAHDFCAPSIAARIRATDSVNGVTEVSTTTSARAGGS